MLSPPPRVIDPPVLLMVSASEARIFPPADVALSVSEASSTAPLFVVSVTAVLDVLSTTILPLASRLMLLPEPVVCRLAPSVRFLAFRLIASTVLLAPPLIVRSCALVLASKVSEVGVCVGVCPTLSLLKVEAAVKAALLGVNATAPVVSMLKPGVVPVMVK